MLGAAREAKALCSQDQGRCARLMLGLPSRQLPPHIPLWYDMESLSSGRPRSMSASPSNKVRHEPNAACLDRLRKQCVRALCVQVAPAFFTAAFPSSHYVAPSRLRSPRLHDYLCSTAQIETLRPTCGLHRLRALGPGLPHARPSPGRRVESAAKRPTCSGPERGTGWSIRCAANLL